MSSTNIPEITLAERLLGSDIRTPETEAALRSLDASATPATQYDEINWTSKPSGLWISANASTGEVDTVSMHAEGVDGHAAFATALPQGIEFSWPRAKVVAVLGAPKLSGPHHDTWQMKDYRLAVEYDPATDAMLHVTTTTV